VGGEFRHNDWISGPRLRTRAELLAADVPDTTIESWLRSGRLHPAFNGVYAVGHPSLTQHERWLAAVLACGEGAALSHLSAALLWEIVRAEGRFPEVSVPRSREAIEGITLHRRRNPPLITTHHGIPTTTIAQTLLDLAAAFTQQALERALGEAQLLPQFSTQELEQLLATRQRGVTKLRKVWHVEHGVGVPRNVMERKFLEIVRATGIRRPAVNQRWRDWEIDALWLPEGIAVELDGRTPHTRTAQFQRDRDKDADLQLAGLIALRYTWADLTRRPAKVTAGCSRAFALARARASSAASGTR
jgi:hypothetical protein